MKPKKIFIDYVPMALAAALIIIFAFIKEQSFFKTLPTLVTLIVQILLVRANRYAFLLGGVNSAIYGAVYLTEGLYFSAVSALAISAPIQIYSFFNWSRKKNASGDTRLKTLGIKRLCFVIGVILSGWALCYFGLAVFFRTATYPVFDTLQFTIGVVVSFLAAFRYVESQHINIVNCASAVTMWALICVGNPSNINYLIISCYNLFMVAKASVNWTRKYKVQKCENV